MIIETFLEKMIDFFPEIRKKIEEHTSEYGERLDTIVVEEIIMPEVIELLKKNSDEKKLWKYLFFLKMFVLTLMII